MKAANLNIIDSYIGLLNNLSPDNKLELISRLSQSLKSEKNIENKPFQELFGAFKSEDSAETIIEDIRKSRAFTRQIEEL